MESLFTVKAKLDRLEAHLKDLIEGSAARLFSSGAAPADLASELISAMQSGIKTRPDGRLLAPNLFTLIVNPLHRETLESNQELLARLTRTIQEAGAEAGLTFISPPAIRIETDDQILPWQFRVLARISLDRLDQTTGVEVASNGTGPDIPSNAFVIVNGTDVVPLTDTVVNIGRRQDNQLVIDDPRVSRVHAQLRVVKGRYVIFDLDSRGGTYVNDQRVVQSILFPGDVISLAGVPLVFGQDTTGYGQTQKLDPLDS